MEQINRIEVRGIVGNVSLQEMNDSRMCKFSVVTNYAYKNREGTPVMETVWHNVIAFEGREIQSLDRIAKGSKVSVTGRFRLQRYVGQDGIDRSYPEIFANRVKLIDDDEQLVPEL